MNNQVKIRTVNGAFRGRQTKRRIVAMAFLFEIKCSYYAMKNANIRAQIIIFFELRCCNIECNLDFNNNHKTMKILARSASYAGITTHEAPMKFRAKMSRSNLLMKAKTLSFLSTLKRTSPSKNTKKAKADKIYQDTLSLLSTCGQ